MLTGYARPECVATSYDRPALVTIHRDGEGSPSLSANLNFYQVTSNFNLREFMSPDTGEVRMVPDLVRRLQLVRDILARPIRISSGYRTPEHNASIGGVPLSPHILGVAADLIVENVSPKVLLSNLLQAGLIRVLFYADSPHVHVDMLTPALVIVPPHFLDTLGQVAAEFGVTVKSEDLHQARGLRGS